MLEQLTKYNLYVLGKYNHIGIIIAEVNQRVIQRYISIYWRHARDIPWLHADTDDYYREIIPEQRLGHTIANGSCEHVYFPDIYFITNSVFSRSYLSNGLRSATMSSLHLVADLF